MNSTEYILSISHVRSAHEHNRKSLYPIIEAQTGIEQQRRELATVQKFRAEFERLQLIQMHMDAKNWSHIVNEFKVQKRKGFQAKGYGKMAQLTTRINDLLAKAKDALVHDFKTKFDVDATSVERSDT